jgi:hypothetical protein
MIDTVCSLIPQSRIVLMGENGEPVQKWDIQAIAENYTKYVRNPSLKDKRSGQYFPRVTSYSRRYQHEPQIKIEFSAPKLLFLNNVEELSDNQFPNIIDALQDRLRRMGIRVFKHVLQNATVSSVHFGRNFVFQDGQTATNIIGQLQKIDIRKSFDFAKSRYINDGQSLCCHTSAHELIFYDKIADLAKGKKRSIDRDQTAFQMDLFLETRIRGHPLEILRMEVRLVQKQKLNAILHKLDLPINPTFDQIFKAELSKKVLLHYWQEMIREKNQGSLMPTLQPIDIAKRIYSATPSIQPKQLLAEIGMLTLAQNENGLRELRALLAKSSHNRTWSRLMKEYRQVSETVSRGHVRSWVKEIENQINNNPPFRLDTSTENGKYLTNLMCKEK